MIPVRLETSDGHHVYDGVILPFVTGLPKIVVWGERVFLLHSEGPTLDRVRFLETAIREAGDRHDAEDVAALDAELEEAKAADEAAVRLGAPAVYRETFWTAVLPPSPIR